MDNQEICKLTYDDAVAMLPDGDTIHTFRSTPIALIGCDWDRKDLLSAIRDGDPQLGGQACTAMGHGLVIYAGGEPLFVETKSGPTP